MNIAQLHEIFLNSSGVCTDTRKIEPGCLFFALRGENFDGNRFTDEALEKGALKVVIDNIRYHRNSGDTILHGNALELLQELATYHRKYLGIPILALTGSNGKTTTKELVDRVLSKRFKTTATRGNLNNHIGVPLSLLSMDAQTEIGIVEMGANHQKEIEFLSGIALPDYGLITNFGKAHLEGFGGVEGVIKGKSELYHHLREHEKLVFVNGNDPKQMELTQNMKRYVFGPANSDCPVELTDSTDTLAVTFRGVAATTNLIGDYNFGNVANAIAVGSYFEIEPQEIKEAIASYFPDNNRSQLLQKGGFEIVLDAYNANPNSMMAALRTFDKRKGAPKVAVLGDMFELGEDAAFEHQVIADYVSTRDHWNVFLVGENFARTTTKGKHIRTFADFDRFKQAWGSLDLDSGLLLLKGSRGMAIERVLELL